MSSNHMIGTSTIVLRVAGKDLVMSRQRLERPAHVVSFSIPRLRGKVVLRISDLDVTRLLLSTSGRPLHRMDYSGIKSEASPLSPGGHGIADEQPLRTVAQVTCK